MIEVKAPNKYPSGRYNLFLAGSIEMGVAENWQQKITNILKDYDITILNPRRDDWDSSWIQSIENDQFREQVEWELYAMEYSSLVVMYFDPATTSPISLLELGINAKQPGKMVVCCPEGFWRKGNVEVVCKHYNIPLYENIKDFIESIKNKIPSKYL